jgi:hypothetical protein
MVLSFIGKLQPLGRVRNFFPHFWPAVLFLSAGLTGCRTTCPLPAPLKQQTVKTAKACYLSTPKSQEILATDMSFDFDTGEIRYTLPEPALVRIRMGIQNGGPLLTHILDWEYRDKGSHIEVWNKEEATRLLAVKNRNNVSLVLSCLPADSQDRRYSTTLVKGFRRSPEFAVTFPEVQEHSPMGHPVLSGITPVRVTIDTKDQTWLLGTKFELAIYIDGAFIMEDEEGNNPYTYRLDTRGFPNRTHILTINIIGYEGEVGVQSMLVDVRNDISL